MKFFAHTAKIGKSVNVGLFCQKHFLERWGRHFWKDFLHYFPAFRKLTIFNFFAKPQLRRKKAFYKKSLIWYTFHSKFVTFNDFEKQTRIVFQNKPKFRSCLRNLSISIAFNGNFALNWWWKVFKLQPFVHFQWASKQVSVGKFTRWVDEISSDIWKRTGKKTKHLKKSKTFVKNCHIQFFLGKEYLL